MLRCAYCLKEGDEFTMAEVIIDGWSLCLLHVEEFQADKQREQQKAKAAARKTRDTTFDVEDFIRRSPATTPYTTPYTPPPGTSPTIPSTIPWKAPSVTSAPRVGTGPWTHTFTPKSTRFASGGIVGRSHTTWWDEASTTDPIADIKKMAEKYATTYGLDVAKVHAVMPKIAVSDINIEFDKTQDFSPQVKRLIEEMKTETREKGEPWRRSR